eukprot:4996574-Alexandrium_andersonii.AAC.1
MVGNGMSSSGSAVGAASVLGGVTIVRAMHADELVAGNIELDAAVGVAAAGDVAAAGFGRIAFAALALVG